MIPLPSQPDLDVEAEIAKIKKLMSARDVRNPSHSESSRPDTVASPVTLPSKGTSLALPRRDPSSPKDLILSQEILAGILRASGGRVQVPLADCQLLDGEQLIAYRDDHRQVIVIEIREI